MAYSAISNGEIDLDSPITTGLMTKMRDNPIAIANGDSGAPKIQTAAINDSAVTTAKIAGGNVTSAKMAAASVKQAALDTSIGEVSTTILPGMVTLPGGTYGFYPQLRASSGVVTTGILYANGTSYFTRIQLDSTAGTAYAQQRYVNSSPPYNLGNGDVPVFVFAKLSASSDVVATYVADVPPWAYNGPTRVTADRICESTGRKFQRFSAFDRETGEITSGEREVCHMIKNADMSLIPHPFDVAENERVILLAPCDTLTIMDVHQTGESISELIYGDYIRIGDKIDAACSPGVIPVSFSWRNTVKSSVKKRGKRS